MPRASLAESFDFLIRRLDVLKEIRLSHPDLVMLGDSLYFLSDPKIVRQVFRSGNIRLGIDALGNVFSEGDVAKWFAFRANFNSMFGKSRVGEFSNYIDEVTTAFLEAGSFDMLAEMQKLTGVLTSAYILGDNVGPIPELVRNKVRLVVQRHSSTATVLTPFWMPTPLNLKTRYAHRRLIKELSKYLTVEHTERMGHGVSNKETSKFLQAVIAAGTLPPAASLTWTWHLLEENREVEAQLHSLVDQDAGEAADYAQAIVAEALRLYPPNVMIQAVTTRDISVEGYFIPSGVSVAYSPLSIHRDERFWEDPEVFRPNRIKNAKVEIAYLPFGVGPNACMGVHFAKLILEKAVLSLSAKFRFRKAPSADPSIRPVVSLVLPKRMTMKVETR